MITDTITITELSRLTKRSRPTIYKWVTMYESGECEALPRSVLELFDIIDAKKSKKEIYEFCEVSFFDATDDEPFREVIALLSENRHRLDIEKIKNFILEEIK